MEKSIKKLINERQKLVNKFCANLIKIKQGKIKIK